MAPLSLSDIGQVSQANCGQLTEQLPVKNREQLQSVKRPWLMQFWIAQFTIYSPSESETVTTRDMREVYVINPKKTEIKTSH